MSSIQHNSIEADEITSALKQRITELERELENPQAGEPNRVDPHWANIKMDVSNPHTKDNWLKQGHAVNPYYHHPAPSSQEPVAWLADTPERDDPALFFDRYDAEQSGYSFVQPLFTHPTTERRGIPEDFEAELAVYLESGAPESMQNVSVNDLVTALKYYEALNAAPAPTKGEV